MKHVCLAMLTYAAAVVQAGSPLFVPDGETTLHVLPAVLVLSLFLWDGWQAVVWAGIVGLVSDGLRSTAIGSDMLCAVLLAGLIVHLHPRRREFSMLVNLPVSGGLVFVFLLVSRGLSAVLSRRTVVAGELLSDVAVDASHTLIAGLIGLLCFNAVVSLLPGRRRRALRS
ncbi:MAG: hypothetical protein ACE5KM_04230 [Planctomycetaceae bacterium]